MPESRIVIDGGGAEGDENGTHIQTLMGKSVVGVVIYTKTSASSTPKYYAFSFDGNTVNSPNNMGDIVSVSKTDSTVTIEFKRNSYDAMSMMFIYPKDDSGTND
jgi:hypothetical protein